MNFQNFKELWEVILSYAQGFDKDIVDAIKEQYLPIGLDTIVPKKPYSITLSLTDQD